MLGMAVSRCDIAAARRVVRVDVQVEAPWPCQRLLTVGTLQAMLGSARLLLKRLASRKPLGCVESAVAAATEQGMSR